METGLEHVSGEGVLIRNASQNLRDRASVGIALRHKHSYIQPELQVEPSPLAELRLTPNHEPAPCTKGELSVADESLQKTLPPKNNKKRQNNNQHAVLLSCQPRSPGSPVPHIHDPLKHLPSYSFTTQELLHHQVQRLARKQPS